MHGGQRGQARFFHQAQAHLGFVEAVQMDAGRAAIQQLPDLAGGKTQARFAHGLHTAFVVGRFQFQIELARDVGPAQ